MASSVRKALGPVTKRLNEALVEAKSLIDLPPEQHDANMQKFRNSKARLEKYSDTYQRKYSEWVALVGDDKDELQRVQADLQNHTDFNCNTDDGLLCLASMIDAGERREKKAQFDAELKLKQQLWAQQGNPNPTGPVAPAPLLPQAAAAAAPMSTVKLPKLELTKFDGTILKWREFWDCFESSVHNNQSISAIDKMNYLKSQLTDDAKRSISGYAATADNYAAAVKLLKDRFGNQDIVINAHYSALADLAPASNQKEKLRTVVDTVEQHLNSLEALGEEVNSRQIVQTIKSKLPHGVLLRLEEQRGDEVWDAKKLREHLQRFLTIRESVDHSYSQREGSSPQTASATAPKPSGASFAKSNSHPHSPSHSYYGRSRSTTDALFASARNPPCAFCGKEDHWSDECRTYTTVEARKKRLKNKCYNCLKAWHPREQCTRNKACFYCKQTRMHHHSLCPNRTPKNTETAAVVAESASAVTLPIDSPNAEGSFLASGETGLLQTATAPMQSLDGRHSALGRAVFDTGSHRSYISATLAKKLQLKAISKDKLSVFTFGSAPPKDIQTSVVKLKIQLRDGKFFELLANVVPTITGGIQRAPIDASKLSPLCKVYPLADSFSKEHSNLDVDLLIGIDYYYELVTSEKIQVAKGLYLIGSRLGWLLSGRYESNSLQRGPLTTLFTHSIIDRNDLRFSPADQLAPTLDPKFLWDLETIGINEKPDFKGDEAALKQFNDTVQYKDNRYFVAWPWKEDEVNLPSNYQLSLGRLNSLLRRHRDQPQVVADYQAVLDQQLERGIIEKVDDSSPQDTRRHYIPHHPVITPGRTTKLRIVYDGSAKTKKDQKSINECLHRGPVFLEDICKLLIRFRFNKVALVADIEKAFLQVGLQETDRDVTRFLWLRDPKLSTTENNLQIYRFARVPFGIISSPFLLAATVAFHLAKDGGEIANKISQNIYVDNVITGVDSESQALEFYSTAKKLFASASMNIREWGSNSGSFIEKVPNNDRVDKTVLKVLGIPWDTITDKFSIPMPTLASLETITVTKRIILQFVASIFDPLGFFCPTTLLAKLLLQKLWLAKVNWDDDLPPDVVSEWRSIISQTSPISTFSIPRYIGAEPGALTYELHGFSDASQRAYGTCIFTRISSPTMPTTTNLLFAKSRVAPVSGISLPRLELLAVQIGTRCLSFVEKSLPFRIDRKFMWTDSQCVLHWLQSKKPLTVFVRNRIAEIKQFSEITFRYVPTTSNPADLASRGKSASELIACTIWWHGPTWLREAESTWPPTDCLQRPDSEEEPSILFSTSALCSEGAEAETVTSPFGIDSTRYSSLQKLLRITAWSLRFINRLRRKRFELLPLSSTEIDDARRLWVKFVQRKHFGEVFSAIDQNGRHLLKDQLGLWLDSDEVLRCGGRLSNSALSDLAKHPILLPKKEHFTELIVRAQHRRLFHAGVSHTLAQLRTEFWIPSGRATVFKIIRDCQICKKFDGGSYRLPEMPPLPDSRVNPAPAFTATGLDYLGPLYIRVQGRASTQKVWICLFTCLSTRAVHLELIEDMSADQFLLCLRRFIGRRGKPTIIISDNAQQFKLVNSALEKIWKRMISRDDVINFVSNESIKWKFITKRAAWQGGFYERLVGLVKQALRKSIGKLCLTLSQLRTVVIEIEATINSRPLVYVGADFPGGYHLTPAHFLSPNPKTGLPVLNVDEFRDPDFILKLSSKDQLIESWKKGQRHLQQFWDLWSSEYLLSLRERSQRFVKQENRRLCATPHTGDVVLERNDGARGTWRLARVVELITGSDGNVRSAKIRMSNGRITNRSLMHLFPLEYDLEPDLIQKKDVVNPGSSIRTRSPSRKLKISGLDAKPPKRPWSKCRP